jgi:vacuolar-type H+-ATPase subunit B/Vma2
MTTPTNMELINAALQELSGILDYISAERGLDDELYVDLSEVEEKLVTVLQRYSKKES